MCIRDSQWFKEPIEVTDKIIDALYDVTKGIIDQLVSIYSVSYTHLDVYKRQNIKRTGRLSE